MFNIKILIQRLLLTLIVMGGSTSLSAEQDQYSYRVFDDSERGESWMSFVPDTNWVSQEDIGLQYELGSYVVIEKYNGNEVDVVIPDLIEGLPVKRIEAFAFADNQTIESVAFGANVTWMAVCVFQDCRNLRKVELNEGLLLLGAACFRGCVNLEEINLPNTLRYVRWDVFRNCRKLTKLEFPNSLRFLHASFGADVLTSINLGGGLSVYEANNLRRLTEIYVPSNFEDISPRAFTAPGTRDLGNGVVERYGLQKITLPERIYLAHDWPPLLNVETYNDTKNDAGFEIRLINDKWWIVGVNYDPGSILYIPSHVAGEKVFGVWRNVFANGEFVDFGGGRVNYSGPENVKRVIIGDGIQELCRASFAGLNVEEVTLPTSLVKIGSLAFAKCENLSKINLPQGISEIGALAFSGCSLGNVSLPQSLNSIRYASFEGNKFSSITIPESCSKVGAFAFNGCTNLVSLKMHNLLRDIGRCSFRACGVSELSLPTECQRIGVLAFAGCDKLRLLTLPNVKYVNSFAFADCSELLDVSTVGLGPLNYGSAVFEGCTKLPSVDLGSRVKSLGANLFGRCEALKYLKLPSSLVEINRSFAGSNLEIIHFSPGLTTIGRRAFSFNEHLSEVRLPNTLATIGREAFSLCPGLKSLVVPGSVTSIDDDAFIGCDSLAVIWLPQRFHNSQEVARLGLSKLWPDKIFRSDVKIRFSAASHSASDGGLPPFISFSIEGQVGRVIQVSVSQSPVGPWQNWRSGIIDDSGTLDIIDFQLNSHNKFYKIE